MKLNAGAINRHMRKALTTSRRMSAHRRTPKTVITRSRKPVLTDGQSSFGFKTSMNIASISSRGRKTL